MKLTGAEIIIEGFKREKVDIIFGYPGGVLIPLFDKLYKEDIKFYLVRHEQGAAHAADGYARSTGKVGVCIATSGPGATNLVTGIATAYMDSIPMVAITGQVATTMIGNDAFQEADLTGITRPITKHNYLVKDVSNLSRIIKEAFHIASTGRPGPVLIDLPVNVTRDSCEFDYPKKIDIRGYKPTYVGHPKQIKKAAEMIKHSERPIIYAGGGVILSGASPELTELVRKTNIPVTLTLMGLGGYPAQDELFMGMLGMHGTIYANKAIMDSDLIIAIGARFDDRITGRLEEFAPTAKIIHIDIDPASISKNIMVNIPIVGDVKNILKELNKIVEKHTNTKWFNYLMSLKKEYPLEYDDSGDDIKPQNVVEVINDITKGEAIISTEVGQNQMWAAQFYKFNKPRELLTSGGLGTMGYGLPAAIGAQVGNPNRMVIDIAGDGSIQMNIQELATISQYKLPVKIIILNNSFLGMVRQWQQLFYERRYAFTDISVAPDFIKLADAYGIKGYRIDKKDELRKILEEALSSKGPALVDIKIPKEENVLPMVPANKPLNAMITTDKGYLLS